MKRTFQICRWAVFGLVIAAALVGFYGMFGRLAAVFSNPQEDMSHGWLVPVFSLYVLWAERARFRAAAGAPSWAGLLLALPCLALAFFGTRGLQVRFEVLAFVGLCVCVPWALWGRRVAALCVFPAAFLLFVIPLSSYLDFVTIHLRLLASATAVGVLNGLGFEVAREGTAIYSTGGTHFAIDIAEPCSGLRSLFALMALTAAYAWFTQPTWTRRGVLFVLSIPLAVLGNVVRILSICLVAAYADPKFALGFYHDYSGYIVFLVAILLMLACSDLITRVCRRRAAPAAAPAPAAAAVPSSSALSGFVPAGLAAVSAVWACLVVCAPVPAVMEAPAVALPAVLPGYGTDIVRYCHDEKCGRSFFGSDLGAYPATARCPACGSELFDISLGEATILPKDTRILRRAYVDPSGARFVVSAVIGGVSKSSIHRPELCLPAQGFSMTEPRTVLAGSPARPFRVIAVVRPGAVPGVLAYTFFDQAGVETASHARRILADVWDRSVRGRIDRWVMISVNANAPRGFNPDDPADGAALVRLLGAVSDAVRKEVRP